MKRNILVFGLISGLISAGWLLTCLTFMDPKKVGMENGMWYGYAAMLVANAFLVVGVKNYRDKENNGVITFGRAFKAGFLIALVASTFYVVTWMIYFYTVGGDFLEYMAKGMHDQLAATGASEAQLAAQAKEMKMFGEMYQNPFFNALITYLEILPLGTIVALFTALALKRKPKTMQNV